MSELQQTRRFLAGGFPRSVALALASTILGACPLAPLLPLAANLLQVAGENYAPAYAGSIKSLLDQISAPVLATGKKPSSAPGSNKLSMSVAILALEGDAQQERVRAVADGDVLVDAVGGRGAGDHFKVTFRTNQAAWVYAFNIDSTGWVVPMFPGAAAGVSAANPVSAGQLVTLPGGSAWYELDEHSGVETIYLIAARDRQPELEEQLANFAANDREGRDAYRDRALGEQARMRAVRSVETPGVVTRGIKVAGAEQRVEVQGQSGRAYASTMAEVIEDVEGRGAVVVTRWFEHRGGDG